MTPRLALAALVLAGCSGSASDESTTTTTEEPVVEETVSLRLQEDGSWTCTGDVGECCLIAEAWTEHPQTPVPPEPLEAP